MLTNKTGLQKCSSHLTLTKQTTINGTKMKNTNLKKSHHPLNTRALLHYVGSIIWHANSSLVTPSQICLKSLYNCALTFLWSNFFGFNMAFWHIAAEIKIKRLSMAEFHWARWALCCTSWSADCFSRTHPKDAHMRVQISRSLTAKCLLKKANGLVH